MSSDCLPAKLERLLIPIERDIGLRCQWLGELIAALADTKLPIGDLLSNFRCQSIVLDKYA